MTLAPSLDPSVDPSVDPSLTRHRFRLIAFDWEGTAVENRAEDASAVRGPVERLLHCGVIIVVLSGTDLASIDGQLSRAIQDRCKRNLYLVTNCGSEIYGFDQMREPILIWDRAATATEDRVLTEIAEAVRDQVVARTGLDVRVIHDRLSRKIDLIPIERWREPAKSALGDLLVAVDSRLDRAGFHGGVRGVVELAREIARAKGLAEARITSDVKHVEIGLTDKADSMRWILRELARPRGISPREILIVGNEFGPIGGMQGSDSWMLVPEAAGERIVSVGPEPAGVPPGVLHLGGGPRRLRELLAGQAALYPVTLPAAPEQDARWVMIEDGFLLAREHELESLFAIGNGFVGSRGSLAEGSPLSAPATFLAGVFETAPGSVPELARAPEWARLAATVAGYPLRLDSGQALEHRRTLDLRNATLWRHWRHCDPAGRITRIEGLRFASLADRHLLVQSITLTAENYSGAVTIEAAALSRAVTERTASGTVFQLVAASRIEDPEGSWTVPETPRDASTGPYERWTIDVELGKTYRLDRIACVHTSREPGDAVGGDLAQTAAQGIERVVEAHRAAWSARWEASDIEIDGDLEAQRAIRFAMYHLISAANPEDEHVSIGARALTGSAYKGHVFWDTEIFMLPFFTLTYPDAARALLMYRAHTLPAARARAARFGYQGALYAWESASTGEDVTPSFVIAPTGELIQIKVGEEEHHISADVAYGVWAYWQATADHRFLVDAGAEILIETARFWASRARREDDGLWHIRRVIGPDEYHTSVDDDAYTNGMARWNLEVAARAVSLLAERWPEPWRLLAQRLRVHPDEPREWTTIAAGMYSGLDPRTGIYEQFQGYFGLEDIDLRSYEPRTAPMDVLLGRERTQRSKIIKQPDVVMLMYLLGHRFPAEVREANFRYYDPRTGHGSSLSPAIHAAMAARLGDVALAERYFKQTMEIDLANRMGNAAGGVHAAALGGLWQAVVFGFAGLALTADGPRVRPRLPPTWRRLRFAIQWHGQRIPIELGRDAPAARPQVEAHP